MPWITVCPDCDMPFDHGLGTTSLADQKAPPVPLESTAWIDIAVSSDEPVKVALLAHFLAENDFEYEESRRFVSLRSDELERLEQSITVWAFTQEMPDDDRHHDSLATTLREIGHAVLNAIHGSANSALPRAVATGASSEAEIVLH